MALTGLRNVIEIIKAISRSAKLHSGNETRSSGSRENMLEIKDLHAEIDGEEILRGFLAGARAAVQACACGPTIHNSVGARGALVA